MQDYKTKLLKAIWDCDAHNMTATENTILICIAACIEGEGIPIAISLRDIARRCKLSESYVHRRLTGLLKQGYLKRVKKPTPTEPAEYLIDIEEIKENTWGIKR